ncbi:MAG: hypothetical protein RMY31_009705 [Dendronalium sp. ChiSLP03b]|nr:hypothetical protein [Dendronalium sp. ChiSLP03b]
MLPCGNAKSEQVGKADGSYFNGGNLRNVLPPQRSALETRATQRFPNAVAPPCGFAFRRSRRVATEASTALGTE